jgi:hypothetical protein
MGPGDRHHGAVPRCRATLSFRSENVAAPRAQRPVSTGAPFPRPDFGFPTDKLTETRQVSVKLSSCRPLSLAPLCVPTLGRPTPSRIHVEGSPLWDGLAMPQPSQCFEGAGVWLLSREFDFVCQRGKFGHLVVGEAVGDLGRVHVRALRVRMPTSRSRWSPYKRENPAPMTRVSSLFSIGASFTTATSYRFRGRP